MTDTHGPPQDTGVGTLAPREELGLLAALLAFLPDGIAFIDPGLAIRAANETFARQMNRPLEAIIGQRADQVLPDWAEHVGRLSQQARASGRPCQSQVYALRFEDLAEQGPTYWESTVSPVFWPEGPFGGWLLLHREVTERERARREWERLVAESRRERELLERVVEEAPAGIVILQGREYRYVVVNPAFRQLSRGKGELVGRTVAEVWPEVAGQLVPLLDRVYETGEPYHAVDAPYQLERGRGPEEAYFSFSYTPLYDARGQVEGILVLAQETTGQVLARRRMEELADEAERRAAEAEAAVRARDEFLAAAAHELKTPVTNLRGFSQLTLRRLEREGQLDPQRARRALRVIDLQAGKLSRLVSQLLDVSRLEEGQLEVHGQEVDLVRLVQETVATAQADTNRHTISLQAPPALAARVDPRRLEQVLANLLDNAIKFSPAGTPIEVELSAPGPQTVRLAVRDHGPGVPPALRDRLFSRFFQAQTGRPFAGLGLGLYVSRQIVELHGGQIVAEFPPDAGTRFVVTLPRDLGARDTAKVGVGA